MLAASSIFVMMNMVSSLGFMTIYRINLAMNSVAEYTTVMKRIEEVLLLDEIQEERFEECTEASVRVRMERVNTTWGFLPQQEQEKQS